MKVGHHFYVIFITKARMLITEISLKYAIYAIKLLNIPIFSTSICKKKGLLLTKKKLYTF